MFLGIHELSLDGKGRLSVPAKLRAIFVKESEGKMILTADLERNLLIFTVEEWKKAAGKLESLSTIEPRARAVQRLYLGYACEVSMDSTGRILIPPMLRKFAGLDKQVVLNSMNNKLELWDQARWEMVSMKAIDMFSDGVLELSAELESLSI